MTHRDRITATELWQSGEPFGPLRMAKALGVPRESVRHRLEQMVRSSEAEYLGAGLYRKRPPKPFIYKARLNDPKGLVAARNEAR